MFKLLPQADYATDKLYRGLTPENKNLISSFDLTDDSG